MKEDKSVAIFTLFFIGCPVSYILFRSLPGIVFHLLPFLGSVAITVPLWLVLCQLGHTNYRRVSLLMAGTILILLATVGFPSVVTYTAKGTVFVESPYLYSAYNDFNAWIDGLINASWLKFFRAVHPGLLPPTQYHPVLYDLRDLAWPLWLGVCIGSPTLFYFTARRIDREYVQSVIARCDEKVKAAEHDARAHYFAREQERNWAANTIVEKDELIAKLQVVAETKKDQEGGAPPGVLSSL
jgi:hypothetical protein